MAKLPLPLLLLHFVLSMNSVAMNSAYSSSKWHNASFTHSFVVFSPPCIVLLRRSSFVSLWSVWFGEQLGSVKVKALRWSAAAYEVRSVGCVLFWCTANRASHISTWSAAMKYESTWSSSLLRIKLIRDYQLDPQQWNTDQLDPRVFCISSWSVGLPQINLICKRCTDQVDPQETLFFEIVKFNFFLIYYFVCIVILYVCV